MNLDISYNYFTGSIPTEVVNLMATQVLSPGNTNQPRVFSYEQFNMKLASLTQSCTITNNWKRYDYTINRCLSSTEIEFYNSSKRVIDTANSNNLIDYEYSDGDCQHEISNRTNKLNTICQDISEDEEYIYRIAKYEAPSYDAMIVEFFVEGDCQSDNLYQKVVYPINECIAHMQLNKSSEIYHDMKIVSNDGRYNVYSSVDGTCIGELDSNILGSDTSVFEGDYLIPETLNSCSNYPGKEQYSIMLKAYYHLRIMPEADVLCAFVNATNINSIYNEWSCGNTASKCSWSGINCQDGSITGIGLHWLSISGKYEVYIYCII